MTTMINKEKAYDKSCIYSGWKLLTNQDVKGRQLPFTKSIYQKPAKNPMANIAIVANM